jgi:hypothetical protein
VTVFLVHVRLEPAFGDLNCPSDACQRNLFEQQAVDDAFDLIRDDAKCRVVHKLATTGFAGVFLFARMDRAIFDNLVGVAAWTAEHELSPVFQS